VFYFLFLSFAKVIKINEISSENMNNHAIRGLLACKSSNNRPTLAAKGTEIDSPHGFQQLFTLLYNRQKIFINSDEIVQICRMEYRFAIIGCGRIADRHAAQIATMGKLIAVCDNDVAKATALGSLYNATAYSSIEDLLEKEQAVNIVSICTPNGLHAKHSILALQQGKHVICEKPLAINMIDAQLMIDTAKLQDRKLFVVKSSRFTPCIQALQAIIEKKELGTIYSFHLNCVWNRPESYYANSWKGTQLLDGGTLYTQFSHYIDALIWLLGEVEEVSGFRSNAAGKKIAFEDTGAVALKMKSGAVGTIHYSVNAFERNQEISLNIVAEKGTITLGGACMNEVLYQHPILIDSTAEMPHNYNSNHDSIYQHVLQALEGKESIITEGESALKAVALIEKIYQQIPL